MSTGVKNPYVGLRPFEEKESILFFGRNEQVLDLMQCLHLHHFIAVVGSSGCGKSSLLRAGMIPSLKAGYMVNDCDQWQILVMKPGKSPLYNLAACILEHTGNTNDATAITEFVKKIKEEGADAVLEQLEPFRRKESKTNFLLLIDQFEELFRFDSEYTDNRTKDNIKEESARKDEAIDFVNIFLEIAQQQAIPCYVVITMRSDFIGDCALFYGLPEAMNRSQYLVPRLTRQQLKMVIEGPAKLFGGSFNPALTSHLVNELRNIKDELPVLQHALMRTWEFKMKTGSAVEIDFPDYEHIGGLEKALSAHADEALQELDKKDQDIIKKTFQALTAIDENGRKIRRPVLLSQLSDLTGATPEHLLNLLDLFIKDGRSFLVISNTSHGSDKIIDISHESLIRQWTTLSGWVDEEGEMAAGFVKLSKAAAANQAGEKDLLTGSELNRAIIWYDRFRPSEKGVKRYAANPVQAFAYLKESEKDHSRRITRNKIRVAGAICLVLAISLIVYYAVQNNNKKTYNTNRFNFLQDKRKTALEAKDKLLALVYTSEMLMLSKKNVTDAIMGELATESTQPVSVLPRYLLSDYLTFQDTIYFASFDPTGSMLTVGLKSGVIEKINMSTGQKTMASYNMASRSNEPYDEQTDKLVDEIVFSDNASGRTFKVYDSSYFYKKQFIDLNQTETTGNDDPVVPILDPLIWYAKGAARSKDSLNYLTWGANAGYTQSTIKFWDTDANEQGCSLIHEDIRAATFAGEKDEYIISWGSDKVIRIWKKSEPNFDRKMPPELFRLMLQVATGVKMNETDYTLEVLPKNEYDQLKEKYSRLLKDYQP